MRYVYTFLLMLFISGTAFAEPTTKSVKAKKIGKVLSSEGRVLVISLGLNDGLEKGSFIEFYKMKKGGIGLASQVFLKSTFAVGRVKRIQKKRAEVWIGINERVPVGAFATHSTTGLTADVNTPSRPHGTMEIASTLRPFLPLNQIGFGTVFDLTLTYRFNNPLTLQFRIDPLGFAAGSGAGSILLNITTLEISFDIDLFELGLGIGSSYEPFLLAFAQKVRFGSIDGLHVRIHNIFVMDTKSGGSSTQGGWRSGGVRLHGQLPLVDRLWVFAAGHLEPDAYGFIEAGVRLLVKGNGLKGSLFLMPRIGFVSLGKRSGSTTSAQPSRFSGPMVGFGVEYRP